MKNVRHYIGLDAHSRNCFFVVMTPTGKVKKKLKVQTSEANILEVVGGLRGGKALATEESTLAHWLFLLLKNEVDELVICDAAYNVKKGAAKTDFRDATELADLLRVGRLNAVYHEKSWRMELRTLVSGYVDVRDDLVRMKNRYKALYRQAAIPTNKSDFYRKAEYTELLPTKALRFVAEPLQKEIEILEKIKGSYEKEFAKNRRDHKEIALLASIPGIGTKWANQLVGIVINPNRFADKYRFFSYAMLTKHRQQSDGRCYGRKSSYGKSELKAIFYGAALSAIRSENAFRRKHEQMLLNGSKETAARGAVARAIAATMLGVWKSGKRYDDSHREKQQKKIARRNQIKKQTL